MSPWIPRQRLAQLAGLTLLIVVVWAFLGVFFASQEHAIAAARGRRGRQRAAVPHSGELHCVGAADPVIIHIADRLPLRAPNRARNAVVLLVIAVIVAAFRAVVDASIPGLLKNEPLAPDHFRATVVAVLGRKMYGRVRASFSKSLL